MIAAAACGLRRPGARPGFLERLEPLHVLPAGFVGQQTAETLDQVAELLGVLAKARARPPPACRGRSVALDRSASCGLERFAWRPSCRVVDPPVAADCRRQPARRASDATRPSAQLLARIGAHPPARDAPQHSAEREPRGRAPTRQRLPPRGDRCSAPTRAGRHRDRGRPRWHPPTTRTPPVRDRVRRSGRPTSTPARTVRVRRSAMRRSWRNFGSI